MTLRELTRQLLKHLQAHTKQDSVSHLGREHHPVPLLQSTTLYLLSAKLLFDLLELDVNTVVIGWCTVDLHHGLLGVLSLAFAILISWRLGKSKDANSEYHSPDEADTHWNSPGCSFVALVIITSIVDAGCQKDAESNEKLIAGDQRASDVSLDD